MKTFDNRSEMQAALRQNGFTIIDKDVFKGNEYAGTWDYTSPPRSGKEAITPVELSLNRNFSED